MTASTDLTIRVGNLRWLVAEGVQPAESLSEVADPFDQRGETALFLAVNDVLWGVVGLRDALREEAREVLTDLKHLGIDQTALLTGDREAATMAAVKPLGLLHQIQCELLPGEKAQWIESQQSAGHRLAMVGDGINDAPALALSEVGIAVVQKQSNLAAEAGDVLLLSGDLKPLPGLLRLSRALVANIRQSILLFAFGLNGLGLLLCAAGVFSPVAGALFHELGSLAVMVNALRLLWFEHSNTQPTSRIANRTTQLAEWLTGAFSPSRWVYRVVDHWNVLLRLMATGLAAWWLLSNVVFLSHDEQALVTRFGKVHAELGSGWHWRWPAPFERIYREKPAHLRVLTYGFRSQPLPAGETRPAVIDWTSPHEKTGEEPVPQESLLLTADEVPLELTALVQYRIADLREFTFGNAQPEDSLRALTGQTLRTLAARTSLDDMLTVGRARLERQCLARLRKRTADLQLGIQIVDVQLVEVHPPRAVVPAYRDVANAMEEKELRINEAQAAANSRLLHTVGPRALAELKTALNWDFASLRKDPPSITDADWQHAAKTEAGPDGSRLSFLAGDTADLLLEAQGTAANKRESAQGEAERFRHLQPIYRAQPELTSTELYWKTLEVVLSSQPFTILDPQAVGRRHLWLSNPDGTEFPAPPLFADPNLDPPPQQD